MDSPLPSRCHYGTLFRLCLCDGLVWCNACVWSIITIGCVWMNQTCLLRQFMLFSGEVTLLLHSVGCTLTTTADHHNLRYRERDIQCSFILGSSMILFRCWYIRVQWIMFAIISVWNGTCASLTMLGKYINDEAIGIAAWWPSQYPSLL